MSTPTTASPSETQPNPKRIAVLGTGGIGSTFAFQLARAGHDVTAIARGSRLETLRADGAIVNTAGLRAPVAVADKLDTATQWDLVLVTVMAHQVDAVLPALRECDAHTIMFVFNTVESLSVLREAVGEGRFAFGFPGILAQIEEGRLEAFIPPLKGGTPVTERAWAEIFTQAGIPSEVEPDMESWLRTHAAVAVPVMASMIQAHRAGAGIPWGDAMAGARALREGMTLVRALGNPIIPIHPRVLDRLPMTWVAGLLWGMTRIPMFRRAGGVGPREPQALIDAMTALAAPTELVALQAIRP